jgi:hypothetical protein
MPAVEPVEVTVVSLVYGEVTASFDAAAPWSAVTQWVAATLGCREDEQMLVAKGARVSCSVLSELLLRPGETVVRMHLVRRPTQRRIAVTLKAGGHRLNVPPIRAGCSVAELRAAAAALLLGRGQTPGQRLAVLVKGRILDEQGGLSVAEYGVDDGSTLVAITSSTPRHAPQALLVCLHLKFLGVPPQRTPWTAPQSTLEARDVLFLRMLPAELVGTLRDAQA